MYASFSSSFYSRDEALHNYQYQLLSICQYHCKKNFLKHYPFRMIMCDALSDLILFVQCTKREKYP